MKRILIAVLIASTAAVAGEGFAAPDDAITQVFAELDRCLLSSNARCMGELMTDDATFAAPTMGTKIIRGKAQIVKSLEELMGAPAPNLKGVKRTHSVENVRMIGVDHAVVDASVGVSGSKSAEDAAADDRDTHHAVAVMALKGGKWLFADLRSYVVGPAKKIMPPADPAKAAAPPASPASEAAPPAPN